MIRRRILTLALVALLTLGALFAIAPAHAAGFTVTRTDDPPPNGCVPDDCSLREAVIAANATRNAEPITITLPAGTFTLSRKDAPPQPTASPTPIRRGNDVDTVAHDSTPTVPMARAATNTTANDAALAVPAAPNAPAIDTDRVAFTGDLDVHGAVLITGAGATATIVQAGPNIAPSVGRVFDILYGAEVVIANMTVRNGNAAYEWGGGIENYGTLTLINSTVSDNTATQGGGGIFNYGGTLTMSNSTVSGNTAGSGGGIFNYDGTLTISNSTISGNTAGNGGGILNRSTLALTNSTVSGNRARFNGGGIHTSSHLQISNSTIAFNSADSDDDGFGFGGGIFNGVFNNDATKQTALKNTLIGDNTRGIQIATTSDCFGTLASQGYNLIASVYGCTISGDTTGNIIGKAPRLGDLKDNGGPTQTRALIRPVQGPIFSIIGSPAINAGDPAGCTNAAGQPLTTDQRGASRPQGARCDIGAFEREMLPPPPLPLSEHAPAPIPLTPRGYLPMMTK